MATPASQLSIPAPANDSFVNGEFAVGIAASAGTVTRHFSRRFVCERSGLYQIKIWMASAGTLKVGPDLAGLTPLISVPTNTTIQTQIYLPKGSSRIDVQAQSSSAAFFALLIFHPDEVIYASAASGWVYENTAPPADADLPGSVSQALTVFPILPNWADGITERLSYLTDILTSETSAEQPRLLRMHPRRAFEAAFLRKGILRSRLDNFLTGIARRSFWMPLWHEQFRVLHTLDESTTFVQFPASTLALREFEVGDRVFVNNADPDSFEVLEVGSIDYTLDRLYWKAAPASSWPVGTRIMPLRKARIVDQTQMQAPVDRVGLVSIRFELDDPEYRFGASWGQESPVWKFRINRGEDITFSQDRLTFALDNSVGPVAYETPGDRPMLTMRSSLTLRGRANVVAFRRFIDQAGGRAGRFYMPTMMQDVLPADDSEISGLTFDAQPAGFVEYLGAKKDARCMLCFVFRNGGESIYRAVDQVLSFSGYERFVLESALPAVQVRDLERIQFMVPSRFDQDTFELSHLVDDSAAVTTSVVTRSVDRQDLGDL